MSLFRGLNMNWISAHKTQRMFSESAPVWCGSQFIFSIRKLNLQRFVPRYKNVLGLKASFETFSEIFCGEQQHINPNIKQTNQPRNFFKRKASTTANHAKAWDAKLRPTRYARPSQTCRKAGTQSHGSLWDSRATVGGLNGGRVTRCTSLGGAFS